MFLLLFEPKKRNLKFQLVSLYKFGVCRNDLFFYVTISFTFYSLLKKRSNVCVLKLMMSYLKIMFLELLGMEMDFFGFINRVVWIVMTAESLKTCLTTSMMIFN